MYGNVIVKNNDGGNGRMCLFGGDSGGSRAGTLYFMNNTVITTRSSGMTTVFQLSPTGNTVQAYNNVIYCPWGGSYLLIQSATSAVCSNNWISPGYNSGGATMSNTIPASGNTPGFVNYAAEDFHLAAASACINAGATTWPGQASTTATLQPIQPLLYEPRPTDSHIDTGAYEYVPPLVGDINQDKTVDVLDLLALAATWGKSTGGVGFDPQSDLNGDGTIDVVDLLILADNWGVSIP